MNQHLQWLWEFLTRSFSTLTSRGLSPVSDRRYVTGRRVDSLGLGSGALVPALLPIGPVRHDIGWFFQVPRRIGGRFRLALSQPLFCRVQLNRSAENLPLSSPCLLQRYLFPLQRRLFPLQRRLFPLQHRRFPLSRRPGLQQVREHASKSDDPTENAENLRNHPSRIQGRSSDANATRAVALRLTKGSSVQDGRRLAVERAERRNPNGLRAGGGNMTTSHPRPARRVWRHADSRIAASMRGRMAALAPRRPSLASQQR